MEEQEEKKPKTEEEKSREKWNEEFKEYTELLRLGKSIAKTRVNRMNAAARLLKTEEFLQNINIYYSCVSAVYAVLSLLSQSRAIAVWSVLVSICLAISIVYLNAQNYGGRSQELKNNYIALHELLFEVNTAIAENKPEKFVELERKYCKLLQTSENHINQDHLKQRLREGKLTGMDKFEYWWHFCWVSILKAVCILLPICVTVYFICVGEFADIFR